VTAYVVDASVAVKWLIYEESSDRAVAFARSNNHFIAPRMIMTEVANALARKVVQGAISSEDAKQQFTKLPYFFDEVVSVDDLITNALHNACLFRHPIYDLIYVEAARLRGIQLVTADRRLSSKLANSDLAASVLMLSDWQPA
jgi:predicted nucleic acid-binding protein